MESIDSLLVKIPERKIDPNIVKNTSPKWLTNERKQAMIRIFLEYPDNCLQGHYLCTNPEHYEYTEHNYYTFAIEHIIQIRDELERLRFDANGKPITVKVCEIQNADKMSVTHKRYHELLIDNAVKYWSDDSRRETLENWKRDRRELHKLNERSFPLRGRFNNISSVIFHDNQPLYYLESIGMNGLTMQPYARVKLASSRQYLYVELGNSLIGISKNRKRKILKYGKLPKESELETIDNKVKIAVKTYLNY